MDRVFDGRPRGIMYPSRDALAGIWSVAGR